MARVHERLALDRYDDFGGLNTAMSTVIAERNLIQGISAWPWDAGTLRGFSTSLLLPILVFLVTKMLGRLIQ